MTASSLRDGATRRILALDGGGVRGVLSIAFLERIEALLLEQAAPGRRPRLCDHFDLIGGTSTGAVIATALALGLSTAELKDFYVGLAPRVFSRSWFRLAFVQTVFDSRALKAEVDRVVGDRRLDSEDLQTRIAIVTKRMDTSSVWIVSNIRGTQYWDDPDDRSYIGNRHYRLADLVLASTAAPYYFAPHAIQVMDEGSPGLFLDGGVSPYNNPSLALLLLATVPAYGLGWETGADFLGIVSVGTGTRRQRLSHARASRMTAAGLAVEALRSMVADAGTQALTLMQALGRADDPWTIDSQVGDLRGVLLPSAPLFTFQRYDARLEREWLGRELDIWLSERELSVISRMEDPAGIARLYEIGQAAAERFVRREHLGPRSVLGAAAAAES